MSMELIGEEKRIRALFSEARFADEQSVPSFAGVWNRAQAQTNRTARAFNLSFVAATALLVCALVSLAWWSRRVQENHDAVIANIPPIVVPSEIVQPSTNPEPTKVTQRRLSDRSRSLKLAERRRAVLVAAAKQTLRDAKAMESWQSPTATLLGSPSDGLLKSLPQLNQTVDELKSFLRDQPQSQPK
jgi:hypothetical protein